MTAALRSDAANPRVLSRRSTRVSSKPRVNQPSGSSAVSEHVLFQTGRSAAPEAINPEVVKSLPQPKPAPAWLSVLLRAQQASSVLTFLLVIAVLAVYGWTVYAQQRWGQEYRNLEALKKQERQLIATNEALKNQIAQQAEAPNGGLVLPDPSTTIFLTPASPRPMVEPEINLPPPQSIPAKPLGY
ncbi:MAG: hypothetical protein HC769_12615 [Cyanobacteria bacterium CRU_2_1]|nr:hypothetical protein [Cyanobacteria bacterium RU_5_0]NJR59608.1 hypothetical protein [Cyanobacteria bacterium CRU_2_1]